jgi:molybdopterin synthase sulfur carrier subunit
VPVQVRIPTVFRRFTDGSAIVEVEPGTLAQIIDQMETQHPGLRDQILGEQGELHRFVNVYVNDEDARYLDKLQTDVSEVDTVSLLPSVAGG